ncbi:MAG: diacylglycerol/lipid kinase family protein [Sporichthyaceae bacterium]
MTPDLLRLARRLLWPTLLLTAFVSGLGAILHEFPGPQWPWEVTGDGRPALRALEALGTASVAVIPIVVLVAGMRLGYRRWREGVFLLASLLITVLVLAVAGAAVPEGSFPATASGVAASTYGAISVVLSRRLGTPLRRSFGGGAPWLLVLAVAGAQLFLREYRVEEIGLSLVTGVLAVGITTRYVLLGGSFEQRPVIEAANQPGRQRAAVIVNPTKVTDMAEEYRAVSAYLAAAGWAEPLWYTTRPDEFGIGHARSAAAAGVGVVFACGGDGTIMSVLSGLAGTGVPLAILPAGTGNLLARNLELPQDRDACLRIGLGGVDRTIDVGRVDETHRFAVMAGMGLDAAMISDAPERLKARIGWPAYAVSALRHILDRRANVRITVDDGEPVELRARGVVIGNVGKLQGGMILMPDAVPDDGILDVAVLVPKSLRGWLLLSLHVMRRRPDAPGARIEHFRGTRIEIVADRAWPRQVDGDLLAPSKEMTVVIEPGALVVRLPGTAELV